MAKTPTARARLLIQKQTKGYSPVARSRLRIRHHTWFGWLLIRLIDWLAL